MARSMTAFARLEDSGPWGRASWELRSVNHRFLEVGLRLPEELRALEGEVRNRVAARCARGKIDCTLRYEAPAGTGSALAVDTGFARQLIAAAEQVGGMLANSAPINPLEVLRWPGVLESTQTDSDARTRRLLQLLDSALAQLVEHRDREGTKLKALVLERCSSMRGLTVSLRTRVPEIIDQLKARHAAKIQEIAGSADPARIEQECALLLQRLDVAEEIDRLETHLAEVARVMEHDQPIGRRLDFLLQELNREANTLGSKSAHVDTTGASVEFKVLIEQVREQIQNLE